MEITIQHTLKGAISLSGKPVKGVQVVAFDKDLRNKQEIGRSRSDKDGQYSIKYTSDKFLRAEKKTADIIVELYAPDDDMLKKSIAVSPIRFNAKHEEEVNFTLDESQHKLPPEFELICKDIAPLLEQLKPESLEENNRQGDVTFLSGETGWSYNKVEGYALAHKLSALSKIDPMFWYALYLVRLYNTPIVVESDANVENPYTLDKKLQAILKNLKTVTAKAALLALNNAVEANFIAPVDKRKEKEWLKLYTEFVRQNVIEDTQDPLFKKLSTIPGVTKDSITELARLFAEHGSINDGLRQSLKKSKLLEDNVLGSLENIFQLNDLTLGNTQLVEVLAKNIKKSNGNGVKGLSKISTKDWEELIKKEKIEVPKGLPGKTSGEKIRQYAVLINKRFEDAYPTTAFAGGLERAIKNKETVIRNASKVVDILDGEDFDILTTSIDSFFAKNKLSTAKSAKAEAELKTEVKAVQRLAKIVPRYKAVNTLLEHNIHSAQQVYGVGEKQFVSKYKDKPGFTEVIARETYHKAANAHAGVMKIVSEMHALESASSTYALNSGQANAVGEFPNWQFLFGQADICECEHCRSVYSPAAYLADLLQYLKDRLLPVGTGSAKDIVLKRRPDLGFISLNCANANTPLPYIDLVAEVLEEEIAPNILFTDTVTAAQWTNDTTIVSTLAGKFSANSIITSGLIVSEIRNVKDRASYQCRVVRTDNATYKVVFNAGAITVSPVRQTYGTSQELAATPQYVNETAYTNLSAAKYPLNLPLDLFTEEARGYLEKAGVEKWELMKIFQGATLPNNPTEDDIAAESLGISRAERNYIFSANTTSQFEFWGYSNDATLLNNIKNAKTFLDRTGLNYNELLQLLDLPYINPGQTVSIVHGDNSCDTATKNIQVLTVAILDRMHRFLRLRKKLGWAMWELDLAINHPAMGAGDIGSGLLRSLQYFKLLSKKFSGLTIEQLGALLGDISRISKFKEPFEPRIPSFYDNLFLNKKLINPLDPAFELTGPATTIKAHSQVVAGASRIKEQDLDTLLQLKKINGSDYLAANINASLSLPNLSFVYRHSQFSRLLGMKITEWQQWLKLLQVDITTFTSAKEVYDLSEKIREIRAAYQADELRYLLTHDSEAKLFPASKNVKATLSLIREDIKKINAAYVIGESVDEQLSALTSAMQKLGFSEESVVTAIAIVSGQQENTVTLAAVLPGNFETFPPVINGKKIKIAYNKNEKTIVFTGVMTDQEKNDLKTDASISAAVRGLAAYQNVIDTLHAGPRAFIAKELAFFQKPVFKESLVTLPANVQFKNLSSSFLRNDVSYDAEKQQLIWRGVMTAAEKTELDNLSLATDLPYRTAVQNLFTQSTTAVFQPDQLWIRPADIANFYNTPAFIDQALINSHVSAILKLLINYIRPLDLTASITQNVVQQFGIASDVATILLSGYDLLPAPNKSILSYFIQGAPPFTKDEIIYHWLNKVSYILKEEKVDAKRLAWFKKYTVPLNLPNLLLLPVQSGDPIAASDPLLRLHTYMIFDDKWTTNELSFIDVMGKLSDGSYATNADFARELASISGFQQKDIEKLTTMTPSAILNINYPAGWNDVSNWKRLEKAFTFLSQLTIDATLALDLANPSITQAVSGKLKQNLRSKYEEEGWFEISKDIQNKLRERKRDGLSAYLLANKPAHIPATQKWENTNDLFSYYLIDVEMCSCQPSSRIVQANGTIQLFVQRCLMGLEKEITVDVDTDENWLHWKWMKNYRVWEANRKIFLYPENWIEPELRRDKSSFFKEFENELMQNEINKDTAETAFLNYLDKLDSVAQLEIAGFFYEESADTLHVFGRTPVGEPHIYYYRTWIKNRRWTPWSKVDVDIKSNYLIPTMINDRLYIFWPEFEEEPLPVGSIPIPSQSSTTYTPSEGWKVLRVRMAVSEWRNKKWSGKKISSGVLTTSSYQGEIIKDKYSFTSADLTSVGKGVYIVCSGYGSIKNSAGSYVGSGASIYGSFEVFGCKGVPEPSSHSSSFYNLQRVTDASPHYMKEKEDNSRGGRNFFTFDSLAHYGSGYEMENYGMPVILDETPGIFSVATSQQVSELDKYFIDSFLYYSHDRYSSSGIWADFFFADKLRTFFVQPVLQLGGKVHYYADVKNEIDKYKRLFEQALEDWLDTQTLTEDEEKSVRELFRKYFNTIVAYLLSAIYPYRQYHFRNFYHPFVCAFSKAVYNTGIDGLMKRETQLKKGRFNFETTYAPTNLVLDPSVKSYYPKEDVDFTPSGSYSHYNWELFFHAPLLIAGSLTRNQRFEEAMQWYHYIFNPLSPESKDENGVLIPTTNPQQKYWITKPFFERQQAGYDKERIDAILRMLAGDTSMPGYTPTYKDELIAQVEDWRDNPFEPHKIAEFRTVAYQKTVLMKYIDNLIAWGDQLFRRDTMETVNEATQLYVLAAEILGPRPRKVSPSAKPTEESYHELEPKLDSFSNALIEVENLLPAMPGGGGGGAPAPPLPTVLYFCIPQNDKMLAYWDIVADRLYKIRHCLNIEGVARQLALFDPPIDPAALVRAVAGGVDISSALNDLNAPLPYYRFNISLQKANELANDVKALGGALLSALEKKDSESLTLLRQSHEIKVQEAVRDIKVKQIDDAKTSLDGLKKNKEMITIRRDYYASRKFMNDGETAAMALSGTTIALQAVAMTMDILSGVLAAIPNFNLGASGFGGSPQAVVQTGGMSFGKALEMASKGISQTVGIIDKSASLVSTVAGYQRRKEDWDLQKDLATKELEQMEKQILSSEIKVGIAERELKNHELQMENSKAIDEFMKSKYTNKELYEWMISQVSQTYFQSYQLAYDLAKKAEKCYQFELGVQGSSHIKFGYWDSLKKGLLSGEKLQFDLRKLESAYMEQNRREFEITKNISLSLLNPLALVQLRETGRCTVNLPEALFDLDYPGHYFRRIKSASFSMPCIVGPHTSVNCTFRLVKNSVRINPQLAGGQYERNNDNGVPLDDDRFRENNVSIKAVATSNAQNDSGLFEFNFKDERYLPFEGAGAISTWSIELLNHADADTRVLRQFDYSSIADVIIHLRYTAREDAGLFKKEAITYLKNLIKDASLNTSLPLVQVMNVKHEFPHEYNQLTIAAVGPNRTVNLKINRDRFPYLTHGLKLIIKRVFLASVFSDNATNVATSITDPAGNSQNYTLKNTSRYGSRIQYDTREFDFEVKEEGTVGAMWDWTLTLPAVNVSKLQDLFIACEYELKE